MECTSEVIHVDLCLQAFGQSLGMCVCVRDCESRFAMVWVVENRLVLSGPKVGSFYPVYKFGNHKALYSLRAAKRFAQLNNLPDPPSKAGGAS